MGIVDFIAIHGGNSETPRLSKKAGWYYGSRSDYKIYDYPYMVDLNPEHQDNDTWNQYLRFLEEHRPKLALTIDFMHSEQWRVSQDRIRQVTDIGIIPVVCVKCDAALRFTPDEYCGIEVRIAFSVPTTYPPGVAHYLPHKDLLNKNQTVHLLGGHPDQWVWIKNNYADLIDIRSIDTNVFIREARRAKWWSASKGGYVDMRKQGRSTSAMAVISMRNAAQYYNEGIIKRRSIRVDRCIQALNSTP